MRLRSFLFKVPKNRKFNYRPRYLDEEKEEWEARKKQIRASKGRSGGEFDRGFLREKLRKERRETAKNQRLLLILALLGTLLFAYFFMPDILSIFGVAWPSPL